MIITRIIQFPIRMYAYLISPLLGPNCRFHLTCSHYMLESLEKHGVLKGLFLGGKRIFRCNPWCRHDRCDPVPKQFAWSDLMRYKRVIISKDRTT